MDQEPKRRGRPPTGNAKTPAERMRAVRARARAVAFEEYRGDFSALSDTGLLEILSTAYRRGMTQAAADVVGELFERMNRRALPGTALTPSFRATVTGDDSATVTDKPALTETVAKNDRTEIKAEAPTPATVTENQPPRSDRDDTILRLHAAGESKRGIARQLDISDGTVRNVLKRCGKT